MTVLRRKVWAAVPLVALLACGGEEPLGNPGGGGTGPGGTGGASEGGSGGSVGGMGGAAVNPDPCDPMAQDCVEPGAEKCALSFDATDALSFVCAETLGTGALGEPCERPNGAAGEDTCAPGLYCGNWGSPDSDQRTCRALCDAPDGCGADAMCLAIEFEPAIGACLSTCDVFGDSCPEGTACTLFPALWDKSRPTCMAAGAGTEGDACPAGPLQCAEGFTCMNLGSNECRGVCDHAHPCPNEGACTPIDNVDDVGFCDAMSWSCVGAVTWDTPTAATATTQVQVISAVSEALVGDVTVRACAADDPLCAAPLDSQVVDWDDALATLTVPLGTAGFDGYFELAKPGHVTTLVYPSRPIVGPGTITEGPLYDDNLIGFFGYADPSRGSVFTSHHDCAGTPAGQLTLSSDLADATSKTEYATVSSGPFPDPLGTSTVLGVAAIGLHPAGLATLTSTAPESGVVATRAVQVRAGSATFVHVEPTP